MRVKRVYHGYILPISLNAFLFLVGGGGGMFT